MENDTISPYDEYGNTMEAFPDYLELRNTSSGKGKTTYIEDSLYRIKIPATDTPLYTE